MSMHMIHGVQVHGKKKAKSKKLDMAKVEVEWRRYNKDMRRKCMHDCQFETVQDYANYITGKMPKQKRKFKEYEAPKSPISIKPSYPSKATSDTIPGNCSRKDNPTYTGDLIIGIGTMHKSNLVPIMRGTNEAIDIANMRR